jgi:hypothetical protein
MFYHDGGNLRYQAQVDRQTPLLGAIPDLGYPLSGSGAQSEQNEGFSRHRGGLR